MADRRWGPPPARPRSTDTTPSLRVAVPLPPSRQRRVWIRTVGEDGQLVEAVPLPPGARVRVVEVVEA